jgi:hypothetical protein
LQQSPDQAAVVKGRDLDPYEASIFRELGAPPDTVWLGDIDCGDGTYYIGRPRRVQTFYDGGPLSTLCDFEGEYNVTGIVAEEPYVYVCLNFAGKVYRVNMVTGATVLVAEGLDYPLDMELLPVVLREPPALN